MKILLRRSPCNLTFGVIQSKGLPQGPPFPPQLYSFSFCLPIALSLVPLFHIHARSVSHCDWLGIGMCWVTWQGGRWSRPTLQHLPGPHYPTHLWAQQIIVRIKHSCVKQQALQAHHNCQMLNATSGETKGQPVTAATAQSLQNLRRVANGDGYKMILWTNRWNMNQRIFKKWQEHNC